MKSQSSRDVLLLRAAAARKPGDDVLVVARICVIHVFHGVAALHLAIIGDSSATLNGSWFVAGVSRH
jgi:hypothetical protein